MKSETSIGGGLGDLAVEGLETQVDGAGDEVDEEEEVDESSTADAVQTAQVWLLKSFLLLFFKLTLPLNQAKLWRIINV